MGDRGRTSRAETPTSAPLDPPRGAHPFRRSRARCRLGRLPRGLALQGRPRCVAAGRRPPGRRRPDRRAAPRSPPARHSARKAKDALDQPGIRLLAHGPSLGRERRRGPPGRERDRRRGGRRHRVRRGRPGRRLEREGHPGLHAAVGTSTRPRSRRAAPGIQRASELLTAAQSELAPVDPAKLIGPLRQPMIDAKAEVDTRAHQAQIAAGLVGLLPPLLGVDGEKTYLLVTLSPSDPRAAGGYPGVYGVLHADGKRVTLTDLGRDQPRSRRCAAASPRRPTSCARTATTASRRRSGTRPTRRTSRRPRS